MPTLLAASVWQRFWEYPFYHHALWAGVAVAALCSTLSVFVVQRRMAFIGQGISHAAFGGAGVALLLSLALPDLNRPMLRDGVIAVFCIATALLIGRIARQRHVSEDSAIGICLVAAMALGAVLLDLRAEWIRRLLASGAIGRTQLGYTPSLHDLLFGNILSVTPAELWGASVLAAGVILATLALFKEIVFFSFDEEAASVFGVRTELLYHGLLFVLGLTIVAAMRLLGVILCSALLILPGAAAAFLSRRVGRVFVASLVIGVSSIPVGLMLSIWLGYVSTGPLIVLTLCVFFAASALLDRIRSGLLHAQARRRPSEAPGPT